MRVKYIENDKYIIAYFPDTLRFFEINEKTKELINSYLNSKDDITISDKFNMSVNEYNAFIDRLKDYSIDKSEVSIPEKVDINKHTLGKLVLNISNKCNLRCKYCYANAGVYNSDEDLMSIDILKKSLDVFFDQFHTINFIQIFGGEPTLNIPAIEYICKYVEDKYNNGEISKLPIIGMVSNGTIMTEEIIELIKKYNIKVTISFDGQPVANDEMRIFPDGAGTSDTIIKNIKKLKEKTCEPSTIEVTYNKYHETHNISIVDIINYINSNFKDISLHIAPAAGSSNCNYVLENRSAFVNSVDDIFQHISNKNIITYSLVQRIITAFNTKQYSSYICDAGIHSLSVSTKGEIYPCFMFTDNEDLILGNIFQKDIFQSHKYINSINQFFSYNKYNNEKCKNCFINKLCTGCLGMNYIESGKMFALSEITCEMYKSMVEKVIVNLCKLTNTIKQ